MLCGQDLDVIWESECANWAGAGEAATEQAEPVHQHAPELSPEQLRLVSDHFDKVHLLLHPESSATKVRPLPSSTC